MNPHFHVFRFLHNRELNELYACVAIRSFAFSIVSIFVPIFLLQVGYTLFNILIYFIFRAIFYIGGVFLAGRVDARFGFKHAILFSNPIFIVFFALLYTLESAQWPLILLAFVWGVGNSLFWVSYHADFSRFSTAGKRGQQVGIAKFTSSMFTVLGPVAGGIILTLFGFDALFVFVALLLVISSIPLFFSKDVHEPVAFSAKQLFLNQNPREIIGFATHGFEAAMLVEVWPLFIFLFLFTEFTLIGFAGSVNMFFSMVVLIGITFVADRWKKGLLKMGALINSVFWVLKTLAQLPIQVFGLEFGHGSTRAMLSVSVDRLTYERAQRGREVGYAMFREISIYCGQLVLFSVLLLLNGNLGVGLFLAAAVSFFYFLL